MKSCFTRDRHRALEVGVFFDGQGDSGQDRTEVLRSIEKDDGDFGVAPTAVSKNLIQRFLKLLWPGPKFTFTDKNILAVHT